MAHGLCARGNSRLTFAATLYNLNLMKKTPYQKAIKVLVEIINDSIQEGASREDAIDQAMSGFEEDVIFALAQK